MAYYDNMAESFRNSSKPTVPPEGKMPPWGKTNIVGKPLPRVDAFERVSGKAEYTYDVILPNMVYAAILRCPHAHAMVKKVDTSAAEKMPGVVGVLTAKSPGTDIPWYGSMMGGPHAEQALRPSLPLSGRGSGRGRRTDPIPGMGRAEGNQSRV